MRKHVKKHLPKVAGFAVATFAIVSLAVISEHPNKTPPPPHIDAISPSKGPDGTLITLTGYGFATNGQGIADYLKIEGKSVGASAHSTDGGKTIQFILDVSGTKEARECVTKLTKKGECKIGVKVVDATSNKESNEVHFTVTPYVPPPVVVPPPRLPTSVQSCFPLVTLSPNTPPAQTINRGSTGSLVKFNLTSDCSVPATFQNFALTLLPNVSVLDQQISSLHLYDDASGALLSSMSATSLSFSNVNEQILPGQTITLNITADIGLSASSGFSFIGICGGCNGVILGGNAMTVGN